MDKEQTPTTDFKRNLAIEIIARFIGNSRGLPIARREFINGAEWGHNQALAAFKKRLKERVNERKHLFQRAQGKYVADSWRAEIQECEEIIKLIDETR